MSKAPKVTIAMPVYNGSDHIEDAIRSILSQSWQDLELIITDNVSTDRTPEIVNDYVQSDSRVRYFLNERNLGAAANYNRGYDHARGEYLKWHAHDDTLSEDFIARCVEALDADPELSVVHGKTVGIDANSQPSPLVGTETPSIMSDDAIERFSMLLRHTPDCFPIFGLMRKSALEKSTIHRPYYGSDRGLLAEMALLGKMLIIEDIEFKNREHQNRSVNLSTNAQRALWNNGDAKRIGAAEQLNLVRHLWELAGRHSASVPSMRLRGKIIGFSLQPKRVGRLLQELVELVAPGTTHRVKKLTRASTS